MDKKYFYALGVACDSGLRQKAEDVIKDNLNRFTDKGIKVDYMIDFVDVGDDVVIINMGIIINTPILPTRMISIFSGLHKEVSPAIETMTFINIHLTDMMYYKHDVSVGEGDKYNIRLSKSNIESLDQLNESIYSILKFPSIAECLMAEISPILSEMKSKEKIEKDNRIEHFIVVGICNQPLNTDQVGYVHAFKQFVRCVSESNEVKMYLSPVKYFNSGKREFHLTVELTLKKHAEQILVDHLTNFITLMNFEDYYIVDEALEITDYNEVNKNA